MCIDINSYKSILIIDYEKERIKDGCRVNVMITKKVKVNNRRILEIKDYDEKHDNNNVIVETRTYVPYPLRFFAEKSLILFIPWITLNSYL